MGATPKSGRIGRLRKSIGSGFALATGSDSANKAEAETAATKRKSRGGDLPEVRGSAVYYQFYLIIYA